MERSLSVEESEKQQSVASPGKRHKSPKKEAKPSSPHNSEHSSHSTMGVTTATKERARNGVMDLGFNAALNKVVK